MPSTDPVDVITEYFATINRDDFTATAELFASNGVLVAPGFTPISGRERVSAYYGKALRLYPEHRDTPTRTIVAGQTATVEIHFNGRLADGGEIDFNAVDVFDFDEQGLIVRMSSWYDSHAVRTQLRELLGSRQAS